jgi:hypothetical protein
VPVRVVDLDEVVRGEYAENAHRKPFLPSEIDAIRRALEPGEKAAAKERMTLGKVCVGSGTGMTRDKIGEFAGVSGETVRKIAVVVKAAEKHPRKYSGIVEEMDETGKVDKAYRVVQRPTHDALGHPYEPGERTKPARPKSALDRFEAMVEKLGEATKASPANLERFNGLVEQVHAYTAMPVRRQESVAAAPPEALFENPEDEPVAPVFEEDQDAADRSSGRSDDAGDWRSRRAAELSKWHR